MRANLVRVRSRNASPPGHRRARGFTLAELVIVIVITGIIAAAIVIFLVPAINAYVDSRRRADLVSQADTALRRMARDIRMAVPNSIRSPSDQCFELVPTATGGRYRMAPNTVVDATADCSVPANCSATLDTSQPSSAFDVLSPLSAMPAAGDWVVIGNQDANDVYAGATRAAISSVSTPDSAFGLYRIAFNAKQFPVGYDGGRFSVVANNGGSQAVFYICDNASGVDANGNGTGTLYRLSRPFTPAYPASCPATTGAAVLATHVRSCSLVYSPSTGSTQQRGFVWMQVDLAQRNETISLSYGAHVDNVP
ncbi:MAG TPA: prepilin-type N-terminal cleavage/methylation domain-containing protein [Noviherbaspirillum sp.]|uniref:prepilin-type N-terminal cleavage/methylation domain-containing protein n=1 Tax=Noviherbaspirillum sp. TaxID=1926288 RepID=UPI002B466459|nr:prepilin-type N-terminal cleavage/methylation domain-containing protein [Noviherbaspirillum sp.]HJV84115.1 prepilin-type N-terminal cleavage/methylation domain-containing protein [Noviherbaspirillum sp.]